MNKDQNISYIQNHLDKPLVLVGMMGVGKSHLGSLLAKELELNFFDVDKLVEEKAGCSINEIFEQFGEHKFRSAEKNTILELLERTPCVIATGGGAVMNEDSLSAIKERSLCVWLSSEVDCLFHRLKNAKDRPLLQKANLEQILTELLENREPFYAQAHITLQTTDDDIYQTLKNLKEKLSDYLKKDRFQTR